MRRIILIVAPHPDDEVLGCGGTIKKLSLRNNEIFILIMSRGKKGLYSDDQILNVRREALAAHKLLGVKNTRFLDFPAPELDLISVSELSGAIYSQIQEIKPQILYLPHRGDIHKDHQVIFDAGLVAARPIGDNSIREILTYETLSETEWAPPYPNDVFIPDTFVNIEDTFESKLEAMGCFKSQLREFPNPRSLKSIEALANFRGSTVGITHAEAFKTIRIIIE
ncbi:MAG: PIG-L family deacetylase [Bacteroidales bacterium]|nr:PIG-L family deacetylase [Bacteroidales bacterium]